jgi:hypothetical protein
MAYDDHVEGRMKASRQVEDQAAASLRASRISIKINRVRIKLDPYHDLFNISICCDSGEWRHTAGSESDLRLFLEGVQAGAAMMGGQLTMPEIPRNYSLVAAPIPG